jgi:hypothetical protein
MIEIADIEALNRTMRARTAHATWSSIVKVHLPWLEEIDGGLDLIESDDAQWDSAEAERLVGAALAGCVGRGRGVSVATKMLHLKRPRLFPVLDQLVADMLGAPISTEAPPDVRAAQATRLVVHLRDQGQRNVGALRQIQNDLAAKKLERSLVRILDAILWSSHPAAGFQAARRVFECRVLED